MTDQAGEHVKTEAEARAYRELIELHSLARYPPMGLDIEVDTYFVGRGLLHCIRAEIPGEQSSRYHLTPAGKERLYATADQCKVGHCPCKDRTRDTSDVIDNRMDRLLAQHRRQR